MKVDIFTTEKKYNIVYADPPWSFSAWSQKAQRHVTKHYATMKKEEIERLPIERITTDSAVLFLWVTYPKLEQGLELIKKWGFKYKTCAFSWVKLNKKSNTDFIGNGYYTRSNNEICLLATKGKILKRISRSVRQIVFSKIEKHSKKPDVVRDRIVELFGNLPRIELFARQRADGWDCFGNEIQDL